MSVDTNKKCDSMLSFPREIGLRRAPCESRENFDDYVQRVNGRASCYTSLYSFKRADPTRPWKMDIASVIMDRAWWDFDIEDGGTIEQVKQDTAHLINKLDGDVRTVFTGRGFHVHQMFEKPVIGTAIAKHIDRYERDMAKGLKTLDGVGHPHKLTRIPDTYNPTRQKWAVNIDTQEFCANPIGYNIPTKPQPSFKDLDPFRGLPKSSSFSITKWIAQNPLEEKLHVGSFTGDIDSAGQIPIPPCLETVMTYDNPKHSHRIALVLHLADNLRWFAHPSTLTSEQKERCIDTIVDFISKLNWRDYNENTTRFHVASMIDYEHVPTKCCVDAGPCWAHDGVKR